VVLFSSHELETVERVCSHVVILHRGKVVADDSIEHLRSLMSAPTLEAIFSQLAVEQDTAAISRVHRGPDRLRRDMAKLQFRVLYREFLFRMVDLELLSADALGDSNKLLGQFAALLIFLSVVLSLPHLLGHAPATCRPNWAVRRLE